MSRVRSVLKSSTTTMSSAQATLSRHAPMFSSSLWATMATDKFGIRKSFPIVVMDVLSP